MLRYCDRVQLGFHMLKTSLTYFQICQHSNAQRFGSFFCCYPKHITLTRSWCHKAFTIGHQTNNTEERQLWYVEIAVVGLRVKIELTVTFLIIHFQESRVINQGGWCSGLLIGSHSWTKSKSDENVHRVYFQGDRLPQQLIWIPGCKYYSWV